MDFSGNSWDNFNALWAMALNRHEEDPSMTHFAMLHADVTPAPGWLDLLIEEMERRPCSLISAIVPLKDRRHVTSAGIGFRAHGWQGALRRMTVAEMLARKWTMGVEDRHFGETFDAADLGYPDFPLLHNNGCWCADLRDPRFYATDVDGALQAAFHFPKRIVRDSLRGKWIVQGESEDWWFSRQVWKLGIPTALTSRVRLSHDGGERFENSVPGTHQADEETRCYWAPQTLCSAAQPQSP